MSAEPLPRGSCRGRRCTSSKGSKVGRLDPKYDAMVDKAMRDTPGADPERLINRRGDIAKGRPDP